MRAGGVRSAPRRSAPAAAAAPVAAAAAPARAPRQRLTARWIRADPGPPREGAGVAVCATVGAGNGPAVLVPALDAGAAARAIDAARRGGIPRLTVASDALLALPVGFDDPLALLAVDLAIARAALDEVVRPAAPAVVAFAGYGPRAALLHAEIAARDPAIRARVFDRAPLRRAVAAALGAEVPRGASRTAPDLLVRGGDDDRLVRFGDATELLLARRPDPSREQIEAAIAAIAATPWRYRPLLTAARTPRADDDDDADFAAEIAAVLLL